MRKPGRDVRWHALEMETGVITFTLVIWVIMPVFSGVWNKQHAGEI